MFHYEPSIRTLQQALRTLYSVSAPSLSYHQRLDIRNLYADMTYSSYLLHRPEHEILTHLSSRMRAHFKHEKQLWLQNGLLCHRERDDHRGRNYSPNDN